jgi:transposase
MYLKEIVQKTKNGSYRKYAQFVESVRTEKGPRQNILLNIGRIDGESGSKMIEILAISLIKIIEKLHLLDFTKDLTGKDSKVMGPQLIFQKLDEEIGIKKILDKYFRKYQTDFDISDAVFNLILNRLSSPCSKNAMNEWQKHQYNLKEYDNHQYYRSMDYLHEQQDEIEYSLFEHLKSSSKSKDKDVSVALFDTTSVVYYGDGVQEESLLKHGFSKARRSDLKQIVVGLSMTEDGIPLNHQVHAGNTNDQSCFKEIIKKFSTFHGEQKVIFVGDRGLINGPNIDALMASGYRYILGFKMRTIPKNERHALFLNKKWKPITSELEYRDILYKGQRLIIYLNKERALKDRAHREEIIARIQERIKNGSILSVVSNSDYKKFLKIQGQKPSLDLEKVEADAIFDGIFILTTNTKLKAGDIVSRYRNLWQCEAGFRTLKSELELQPLYHRKERRIRAHVFICFMALVLKQLLIKKLRAQNEKASYSKTMNELNKMHAMSLKVHKTDVTVRTEIGQYAKDAFRALSIGFPKKVLKIENPSTVIIRSE